MHNKYLMLSLAIMFLLVLSILPLGIVTAGTPTPEQVNDYSLEVASFVKEKCHGDCENVVILGDDYVVPSFRRDIKWLNWYYFVPWLQDSKVDKILTDIGYVQRKAKTFAEFDDLFKINANDRSYEGKDVVIIRPDNLATEQNQEIDRFKQILIDKGYKPDFIEKKSSQIYCNDPQLWNNLNGVTIFVFGTEENNYAYNCFPFQAGVENRDAAFIDINPWDGRNYAVIVNTNDANVINAFTEIIESGANQNLKAESAYFFNLGVKYGSYAVMGLALAAVVVGSGGTATPALLLTVGSITDGLSDGGDALDTCIINYQGVGWCSATVAFAVIPMVPAKPVKTGLKAALNSNLFKKFVSLFKVIEDSNIDKTLIKAARNTPAAEFHMAKGADRFLKEATSEADQIKKIKDIPFTDANKLEFLKSIGKADEAFNVGDNYLKKIEFSDELPPGTLGRYERETSTIKLPKNTKDIKDLNEFTLPHEISHAKQNEILKIPEDKEIWDYIGDSQSAQDLDEFATNKLAKNNLKDSSAFTKRWNQQLKGMIGNNFEFNKFSKSDWIAFKARALEIGDIEIASKIDSLIPSNFKLEFGNLVSEFRKITDITPNADISQYSKNLNQLINKMEALS